MKMCSNKDNKANKIKHHKNKERNMYVFYTQ
jgi:hypothetical protein